MKKTASLGDIVKMLDQAGWEKGFAGLLILHKEAEKRHAYLAGGDFHEQQQAGKLMTELAKQDETLVRIQIMAKDRGITLDGRH